jgi:hypothetical protein
MSQLLQSLNLMLRLALELSILAALAVWAWRRVERRALGELAPSVPGVLVEVALFAAATAALVAVRHPRLAAGFATAVLANAALMALWAQ